MLYIEDGCSSELQQAQIKLNGEDGLCVADGVSFDLTHAHFMRVFDDSAICPRPKE